MLIFVTVDYGYQDHHTDHLCCTALCRVAAPSGGIHPKGLWRHEETQIIMEVSKKVVYDAPRADAVELKTEGIVCDSQNRVLWILSGEPTDSMSSDAEWDRSGYGSAESF